MMLRYSRRLPGIFMGFGIMACIGSWHGLGIWPCLWLLGIAMVTVYRICLARSIEKLSARQQVDALPRLIRGFAVNGLATCPLAVMSFFTPTLIGTFAMSVMLIGALAVSAASVAASMRAFVGFGTPTVVCLLGGWLIRGDEIGYFACGGILFAWAMFLVSVRDQNRTMWVLMGAVEDNAQLSTSVELERDRARAASKAKTRFFAAASHDLRQPLHALSINATTLDILVRRTDDELLKQVSHGISSALRHSASLLDGILDISRLDAQAIDARLAPFDMCALLRAVRDDYAPLAAQRGLSLELRVPPEPLWGWTDRDQFMRILGNLVNNAIKFTRIGGVTLSAAKGPGHCVLVCVIDTGPGIAPDQCGRVFEEFYQIDNASRDRSQGLGLGLAIVQRTANLLKHKIRLDSVPGFGTLFELQVDAAVAPPQEAPPTRVPRPAPVGRPLAVLVVDDEVDGRAALSTYLQQLGWPVETAADGEQAARLLQCGFVPDVLLVDYRLREETGLDVLARLRLHQPGLVAVIVTGETAPDRFAELSGVAARVLHKPVVGGLLAQVLQEVVAEHEREGAGAQVTASASVLQ
ncbi:hybrid sensor histidine kinase/response regulator [Variovorax sp. J22R133]|nr:hybrid sensor histidine kinase/response regulator [Variovorax sp. J22R133]